jgi:hypothetical protein
MEVVWNEREHFGTVRKKLDKFSTGRGNQRIAGHDPPERRTCSLYRLTPK